MAKIGPHIEAVVGFAENLRFRQRHDAAVPQARGLFRAQHAGRESAAYAQVRKHRRLDRGGHGTRARHDRGLSPLHPGADLHFPLPSTFASFMRGWSRPMPRAIRFGPRRSIGRLLDQRASAGTAKAHFPATGSAHRGEAEPAQTPSLAGRDCSKTAADQIWFAHRADRAATVGAENQLTFASARPLGVAPR